MVYIENKEAYEAAIKSHIRDNCAKSFVDKFVPAHPEVDWERAFSIAFDKPESFVAKLVENGRQYAKLTEKQVAALVKALAFEQEKIAKRGAMKAQWEAEAQALRDSGVCAPAGRVTVVGVVKSIKEYGSLYGPSAVYKMLVVADEGYKVFVSVPSAIDDVEVGDVVRFDAELVPSDTDVLFAKGKRPSKAVILKKGDK